MAGPLKVGGSRMYQIIYRWEVEDRNKAAFLAAWEETTKRIRETTDGARGSLCIVSVDRPTEIITMAKWDRYEQWAEFVRTAKSESMKEMHALGTQISHDAYVQLGDFTV